MALTKIQKITEKREVDLFGQRYIVRSLTKGTAAASDDVIAKQTEELEELAVEQGHVDQDGKPLIALVDVPRQRQVEHVAAEFDVLLEPKGDDTPPAGDHLLKLWEGDELDFLDVKSAAEQISEQYQTRERPTPGRR